SFIYSRKYSILRIATFCNVGLTNIKKWFYHAAMATPRCPYCNAQGLKYLDFRSVGPVSVIFCAQCGAIHGIITLPKPNKNEILEKQIQEPTSPPAPESKLPQPATAPKTPPGLLALAGNTEISLAPISPDDARQRIKMVSMFHGGQKHINVLGETGICPTCNCEMVKMVIPDGYENSGQTIYYCPNYDECGQWYFVFSELV
ncbi:MAG: hypothetical protein JXM69_14590, partial [Anaerolineae bacterium]|nr:hypothetical protein [Anaerolineae bacterium]